MTPTLRLTTALRSLADALEGNGRHPLPCSDAEMPARRLLERLATVRDRRVPLDDRTDAAFDVARVLHDAAFDDAMQALCDAGLCDE